MIYLICLTNLTNRKGIENIQSYKLIPVIFIQILNITS